MYVDPVSTTHRGLRQGGRQGTSSRSWVTPAPPGETRDEHVEPVTRHPQLRMKASSAASASRRPNRQARSAAVRAGVVAATPATRQTSLSDQARLPPTGATPTRVVFPAGDHIIELRGRP